MAWSSGRVGQTGDPLWRVTAEYEKSPRGSRTVLPSDPEVKEPGIDVLRIAALGAEHPTDRPPAPGVSPPPPAGPQDEADFPLQYVGMMSREPNW